MKTYEEELAEDLRLAEHDFGPIPPEAMLWIQRMHRIAFIGGVHACSQISKPDPDKRADAMILQGSLERLVEYINKS